MKRHSDEPSPPDDPRQAEVSKTRRKAQMHALQDLGEALIALDQAKLMQLDLPERLVDAIIQARSIRAHEGRRRQMQYIGKLMRDIDPDPVREALERFASGIPSDRVRVRRRRAVARGDAARRRRGRRASRPSIPTADAAEIASLVRDARVERSRGGPPHRYRELFRKIRQAAGVSHVTDELLIGLVSISDRASSGVYEDKGLPGLTEWFAAALASPYRMIQRLIPDEQAVIERTLVELCDVEAAISCSRPAGQAPRRAT